MFNVIEFIELVRNIYNENEVLLHRPIFSGNEIEYLSECVESNFVSSVGKRVVEFEEQFAEFVGVRRAIASVNGTSALHIALHGLGVGVGTQVLTQSLTFVATSNAVSYCGAEPVFIDVDIDTLGMSPNALLTWLEKNTYNSDGIVINKNNGKIITACLPMHTFGLPCRIKEICNICEYFSIPVVEDAAESLGSYVGEKHTGCFGKIGTFSFNGNKIITTGGGGMIVTNDDTLADRLKHLTTTAKRPDPYQYYHDEIGFNYRMPNLNAALGVAQMEKLSIMLKKKKDVANIYADFFENKSPQFIHSISGHRTNYWLNAIIMKDRIVRDHFLNLTNVNKIMTRPIWDLMSELPMYNHCEHDGLENSKWLVDRVVNIPSSVPQ